MSSTPLKHKRIAVFPGSSRHTERRLLDSLAELYPIDFVPGSETSFARIDAAIFFCQEATRAEEAFEHGVSSFAFDETCGSIPLAANAAVSFPNDAALHPAFRNARIPVGTGTTAAALSPTHRDTTLACHESLSLWLFRSNGKAELHTTALGPPKLRSGELMWLYLQPQNWLTVLPLLHFLRRVTADVDWSPVPQYGCFIFDDPNLHSVRYGYLDFVELAREASAHNYHAALATVPLDAWYAAPKAVELFRNCPKRLSLLIHGNDHVRNELARDYGDGEALRVLAQALKRVAGLERRTGLTVSRIVAAPHGGCSESMIAQMLRLPLEGAAVSAGPTVRCNPGKSWPLGFGLTPVCFMAGGFPVIRRFHLRYALLPLRFAAFLGQPILSYGHHQNCADGLGPLAEIADTVNTWAPTAWTDPQSIFRGLYRTRRQGELLQVQMCARQARVVVPEGISHVVVYAQIGSEAAEECEVTAASDGGPPQAWGLGVSKRVTPSTVLKLSVPSHRLVDPATVSRPGYRIWPPVRRALAIGRDRMTPILRNIRGSSTARLSAERV